LDRGPGNCPGPEISGTSSGRVCEREAIQAKSDPALPDAGGSNGRDPVMMEERRAMSAPYLFET
jgi:hypothetical protein